MKPTWALRQRVRARVARRRRRIAGAVLSFGEGAQEPSLGVRAVNRNPTTRAERAEPLIVGSAYLARSSPLQSSKRGSGAQVDGLLNALLMTSPEPQSPERKSRFALCDIQMFDERACGDCFGD
jgi:hypothetical protein